MQTERKNCLMKVCDAIKEMEDKSTILKDMDGNKFQRISSSQIMQIWDRNLLGKDDSSVASSIRNDEFLEKYLHTEFEIVPMWYDNFNKFPVLCKVKENGWQKHKIVCFQSRSDRWFQTQHGESYTPNYNTEITPLKDDEIDSFKGRYK